MYRLLLTIVCVPFLLAASKGGRRRKAKHGDSFQITWVGDTLIGGGDAQRKERRKGLRFAFQGGLEEILASNYSIGNAEAPITKIGRHHFKDQKWSYNMAPEAANVLKDIGFKSLGLANNHCMDRGLNGLLDTRTFLEQAGIVPFGAGPGEDIAYKPLLISTPFGTVGVVGMQERPYYGDFDPEGNEGPRAAEGKPQPCTALLRKKAVERSYRRAKEAGAKWVVGFVHWGLNYRPKVHKRQRRVAKWFAHAGYDLVVGHGPHVAQRVGKIDGMPVLYSLGNFAFGTAGRFYKGRKKRSHKDLGFGLVARTYITDSGIEGLDLHCIAVNNKKVHYQPRPCRHKERKKLFKSLGQHVSIRGTVARVHI